MYSGTLKPVMRPVAMILEINEDCLKFSAAMTWNGDNFARFSGVDFIVACFLVGLSQLFLSHPSSLTAVRLVPLHHLQLHRL